jgi:DnaK suppressor protein
MREMRMTTRNKSTRTPPTGRARSTVGVKRLLRERLDRVSRRVCGIEADLKSPHDQDWAERATELENDDVLVKLDEMSLAERHRIREALRRIESGGYGICTGCGQRISAERLSAIPTAATCAACASADGV